MKNEQYVKRVVIIYGDEKTEKNFGFENAVMSDIGDTIRIYNADCSKTIMTFSKSIQHIIEYYESPTDET